MILWGGWMILQLAAPGLHCAGAFSWRLAELEDQWWPLSRGWQLFLSPPRGSHPAGCFTRFLNQWFPGSVLRGQGQKIQVLLKPKLWNMRPHSFCYILLLKSILGSMDGEIDFMSWQEELQNIIAIFLYLSSMAKHGFHLMEQGQNGCLKHHLEMLD